LGLDQHPQRLATELDLGGAGEVRRGLVEVLAVAVESTGHLAHTQTNRRLSGIEPGVQRRARPIARGMPPPPPEPHAAVDRQYGEVLAPLVMLGLARARVLRRGEKRLAHEARSVPSLLTATSERVCFAGDASCRTEAEPMDFPLIDYLD